MLCCRVPAPVWCSAPVWCPQGGYGLARSLTLQALTDTRSEDTREVPQAHPMQDLLLGYRRAVEGGLGPRGSPWGGGCPPALALGFTLSLGPTPANLGEEQSRGKKGPRVPPDCEHTGMLSRHHATRSCAAGQMDTCMALGDLQHPPPPGNCCPLCYETPVLQVPLFVVGAWEERMAQLHAQACFL